MITEYDICSIFENNLKEIDLEMTSEKTEMTLVLSIDDSIKVYLKMHNTTGSGDYIATVEINQNMWVDCSQKTFLIHKHTHFIKRRQFVDIVNKVKADNGITSEGYIEIMEKLLGRSEKKEQQKGLQEKHKIKKYRKKQNQPMYPYIPEAGLPLNCSVSAEDKANGSPKEGDMIAYNPKNLNDVWLVAKEFFEDNYEEVE